MAKTTVTFFSNATEHELVRQPRNDKPVPSGVGWINETRGVKYKFLPAIDEDGKLVGRLDVFVGQDKLQDHMGWLRPDEDDAIERDAPTALRAHKEYRRDFWQAAVPAKLVRARIRSGIANLNGEDLEALISEERAEHNRRELVTEAQDALELVREQMANIQAAQEQAALEEQEKAAKAKPKAKAAAAA